MPNALVLVTDRLGSSYLGPYGNTWIETPAWNQLAARSVLVECALNDSADLSALYHSYWQGRHACSARHTQDVPPLATHLAGHDVQSWLITDEPAVAQHAAGQGFRERVVLSSGEYQEAEHVEQTQLARLFATVTEVLEQARSPFLIWVHAQAMQGPWDAPYALRCRFAEEEDPEPPRSAMPPECTLSENYDPDELLGYQHAYGGQVSLLDTCLGVLLEALWSSSAADTTMLLATAARGYPLGEHRYVGRTERLLQAELLQVPWLLHCPAGAGAALRAHQLIQPPDVYPTLLEWFDVPLPALSLWGRGALPGTLEFESRAARDRAASVDDRERAIRVPGWFLRHDATGKPLLYVKPDDRWECNEIADRCPEVVEELAGVLQAFESAAHDDDRPRLTPLTRVLYDGLE
ncbi:MAG: sulfatase-like hydrolase/transferase [Pirellulaceae bacterium]